MLKFLLSLTLLALATPLMASPPDSGEEFKMGLTEMSLHKWDNAIRHFSYVEKSHPKYTRAQEMIRQAQDHKINDPKKERLAAAEAAKERARKFATRIPYRIVDQWKIPNGGFGKVILIDPKHKTEKDMRALGETLKQDTTGDRNAFIFIYDNERASKMHRKSPPEGTKEGRFFDEHSVGNYMRNINTGHHAMLILLKGVNGNVIQVKY